MIFTLIGFIIVAVIAYKLGEDRGSRDQAEKMNKHLERYFNRQKEDLENQYKYKKTSKDSNQSELDKLEGKIILATEIERNMEDFNYKTNYGRMD